MSPRTSPPRCSRIPTSAPDRFLLPSTVSAAGRGLCPWLRLQTLPKDAPAGPSESSVGVTDLEQSRMPVMVGYPPRRPSAACSLTWRLRSGRAETNNRRLV